jgi:transcriptional regulator with XRE-family HTH domain
VTQDNTQPAGSPFSPEAAEYAEALGERIRAVRTDLGLSLHDVEIRSGGRLKGGAVGTYERAHRTLTLPRLYELSRVYGVSVADLLPDDPGGVRPVDDVAVEVAALIELRAQEIATARAAGRGAG